MALYRATERESGSDLLSRDIRKWEVRTRLDGERLGKVVEVLLDEDGTPRHLEVDLDDDDRTILLPVGHATLDDDDDVVWVPGLARSAFSDIPEYGGQPGDIAPEDEMRIGSAYDQAYGPEGYYESPHYRSGWGGRDTRSGRSARSTAAGAPVRLDTVDDVDVASHEHDPTGWEVVDRDGEHLGKVDHLLGDLEAMKVQYLAVKLDRDILDEDRIILLPAGHVDLEPEPEHVRVHALDRDRLRGYPGWTGGDIDRPMEREVTEYLEAGYRSELRYRHPRYRAGHLRSP